MTKSTPTVTVEALHDDSDTDDFKRNVLVNLTGTDIDHRLVREARMYAVGTDGQLVLVSVMSDHEFIDRQRAYARIKALPQYALDRAEETSRLIAAPREKTR